MKTKDCGVFVVVVLCIGFFSYFLYPTKSLHTPVQMTYHESNTSIHASPQKSSQCSCLSAPTEFNLEDFVDKPELSEVKRRREAEYKQHQAREQSVLKQLLLAQPNSPLMYPIQGVRVLPLQETSIPGTQSFLTS
ncbi:B4GN2 acetylgalactosaminyltransferase, partial [Atractosteus spatula]|nr:B4GN2 acetylgalactosaminyltransferase [Atractosteus spatula]